MWKFYRWHFTTCTAITYNCQPIADEQGALRLSAKVSASAFGLLPQTTAFISGLPRCRRVGAEQYDLDSRHTIQQLWVGSHCRVMRVQIWRIVQDTGPKRCRNVWLGLDLCCRFVTHLLETCCLLLTAKRRECFSLAWTLSHCCGHLLTSTATLRASNLLVRTHHYAYHNMY